MIGLWRPVGCAAALLACLAAAAPAAQAQPAAPDAAALRASYEAHADRLANSPFGRPLVIDSVQSAADLTGSVHAVVPQPYTVVQQRLSRAEQWCDVLILHLNVKHCAASEGDGGPRLDVALGKKVQQDVDDAYGVSFDYRVVASSANLLQVQLRADEGPLGTRDYRIVFEAMPLDAQRSFLHLRYSYGYGLAARVAMQAYLSTLGAGKVGFTVIGRQPDGQPRYVGNVRGVVERNTMRYYLAIEAYLASLALPAGERVEKRLQDWFAATERYSLQLHEIDRDAYLAMKRREIARQ